MCTYVYIHIFSMVLGGIPLTSIIVNVLFLVHIKFGLFGFYGISTLVGYNAKSYLYIHILDIYDLVCLGSTAYQPL